MQLPSIGTAKHFEHLKEHLGCEFRSLEKEGVQIIMSQRAHGSMNFIDLDIASTEEAASEIVPNLVKGYIAQALSDVIVDELEESTIRRILRRDYLHFPPNEQEDVFAFVVRELLDEQPLAPLGDRKCRKHQVLLAVLDYLQNHNEIILEGFVRFRVKEYLTQLENAVDHAVDEYLMEKEYGEFIRLLRYFVDTQEPGADETHVIIGPNGKFWLADSKGQKIRNDAIDDLVIEMADGDIDYEDVLMSNLITLAPLRVVVHKPEGVECIGTYLETIKNVFGNRVSMCPGCEMCSKNSVHLRNR